MSPVDLAPRAGAVPAAGKDRKGRANRFTAPGAAGGGDLLKSSAEFLPVSQAATAKPACARLIF
jgi:hypothetical protein